MWLLSGKAKEGKEVAIQSVHFLSSHDTYAVKKVPAALDLNFLICEMGTMRIMRIT